MTPDSFRFVNFVAPGPPSGSFGDNGASWQAKLDQIQLYLKNILFLILLHLISPSEELPDIFGLINFLAPGPPSGSFGTPQVIRSPVSTKVSLKRLEGAPGAILVIKAILLRTQNYGKIGDKK